MKILVIRGGGIGDFVVTLPMLRTLRERWPQAHIELLGQPSIAQIALHRFYLNAVRSVDHGPFARFFAKGGDLDREWMAYMESFDLVVSYFFDPDDIFQTNLEKCGLVAWKGLEPDTGDILQKKWLLRGEPRIKTKPAALQLCEPLKALGLETTTFSSKLFPTSSDLDEARKNLPQEKNLVAIHPGSGSSSKNWPLRHWEKIIEKIFSARMIPVIIGGEADVEAMNALLQKFPDAAYLRNLPLTTVAAALQICGLYIGHDTGISHIAAAAGAKCLLLFGPTDPEMWAPPKITGQILRSEFALDGLTPESVWSAFSALCKQST